MAFGTPESVPASSLPFPAPAHAPVPSKAVLLEKDVQILLGTYAPNFLLWLVWNMQIIDVYVTQSMIPNDVASIVSLNTSTFKDIAPGMYDKWPNSEMQIEVNATTQPTIRYASFGGAIDGAVRLNAPISWRWQVTDHDDGLTSAFITACDINATLGVVGFSENVTAGNGSLKLSLEDLSCKMDVSSSQVGKVDASSLNSLFSLLLGAVIKPKVNDILKKGISIPIKFGPVTLENVSLAISSQSPSVDFVTASARVVVGELNEKEDVKAALEPKAVRNVASLQKKRKLRDRHRLYVPQTTPYGARTTTGKIIKITDAPYNAVPGKYGAYKANMGAITKALADAGQGDTVVVPGGQGDFYFLGGVIVENKTDVTLQVDGMLRAVPDFDSWATGDENDHQYNHVIVFKNCNGVTVTSSTDAVTGFDGQGKKWWNEYTIGKSGHGKKRPKMLVFKESENILVEKINLINSPSFNLLLSQVLHAEVRYVRIEVDKAVRGEEYPRVSDARGLKLRGFSLKI